MRVDEKIEKMLDRYLITNEENLTEEDIEWFDNLFAGDVDPQLLEKMSTMAKVGYAGAALTGGVGGVAVLFAIRKYLASCINKCYDKEGVPKARCLDTCRKNVEKKKKQAKIDKKVKI